jgi:tyrosine-protein phosphatase SIW14
MNSSKSFKSQYEIAAVLVAAVFLAASAAAASDPSGVSNFHKVNDYVYRGAQPTDDGLRNLAKLGIKTVIDLREADGRSIAEAGVVKAAGMTYVSVPMLGLRAPTAEQVSKVLTILDDNAAGPVFVHCRRGADRTGTVIACYRITHDHWDNAKALTEARSFGMAWIEKAMQGYVMRYQPILVNASDSSSSPQRAGAPSNAFPSTP